MQAKKLYLRCFGCQMNEYDAGRIADLLRAEMGYERVDTPEESDLVVVVTCSIREKAQEKTFSDLGRLREIKRNKPGMLIAVGGCVASQEGRAVITRAPEVDIVFGPQTLHRLPEMIEKRLKTGRPQVDVSFPKIEKFDRLPPPSVHSPSAFVSIMEGCSNFCSYCIVPYTRGAEISRPMLDVLLECVQVSEQGAREVTLLGQNVNSYLGAGPKGEEVDLAMLLEYISEIDGIDRIRFMTSHPHSFDHRLIQAFATLPKLAGHVHLPVQSGSDRILAAMKRGYTHDDYLKQIAELREARPDICISSDFIVGFPGETEADFGETMRLVKEVGFDASFSFVYSKRPGTPAALLPDDTPREVKLERLKVLQAELEAHATKISKDMLGRIERCLVLDRSKRDAAMLGARTDNNRIVNFAGDVGLIGKMVDVRITDVFAHTLGGELVCNP